MPGAALSGLPETLSAPPTLVGHGFQEARVPSHITGQASKQRSRTRGGALPGRPSPTRSATSEGYGHARQDPTPQRPVLHPRPPRLAELRAQRADVAAKVEELVRDHPLCPVLMSMPGNGSRTTAWLLTELADKGLTSATHMASYVDLADPPLGHHHPRRTAQPGGQGPQPRAVPRHLRLPQRPSLPVT